MASGPIRASPVTHLASALLANGVDVVGQQLQIRPSPWHLSAMVPKSPTALFSWAQAQATVPNLKATQVELYPGLEASSVNGWPSVDFDVMGYDRRLWPPDAARVLLQNLYVPEKALDDLRALYSSRRPDLGATPVEADPDSYDRLNQHCDVLVVGAGPAG